jgi:heme/copper-type cytochrome/quinol oxidase subunit 2
LKTRSFLIIVVVVVVLVLGLLVVRKSRTSTSTSTRKIEEGAENERTPTGFHRAGFIILATSYSRTT